MLENLIVRESTGHSIWFRQCRNVTIRNVDIYDSGGIGMRFERRDARHFDHQNIEVRACVRILACSLSDTWFSYLRMLFFFLLSFFI